MIAFVSISGSKSIGILVREKIPNIATATKMRLNRIINTPARGLGAKTIETAQRLARAEGKSLYHVIEKPRDYAPLEKSAAKMRAFVEMIESLAELLAESCSCSVAPG